MKLWSIHRHLRATPLPGTIAILLAGATLAQPQTLAIRTSPLPSISVTSESGTSVAVVTQITRTPELLIILSPYVVHPPDLVSIQTFTITLFQKLRFQVAMRIGFINGDGNVDVSEPVRSAQEIRKLMGAIHFDASQQRAFDPVSLMSGLATSLQSIRSDWGYTLIPGNLPHLPAGIDPNVDNYAMAYLTQQFISQKRSLLFWDPNASVDWASTLSRVTGGFPFQQPGDLAAALLPGETLISVAPNLPPPNRGFRLDSIRIDAIPELAGVSTPFIVSSTPTVPEIARFTELRTLTADIKSVLSDGNSGATELSRARDEVAKALAVNPADWTAVNLGIALTARQGDTAAEIPLLMEAVELRPVDADLWSRLGNLQYDRKDLIHAEESLMKARQLGMKNPRIAEQLGRIRYESQDYAHAEQFIDESLSLDATQQALWFLAADIGKSTRNTGRQAECLERALALGGIHIEERTELIQLYISKEDKASAARHVDTAVSSLPAEAGVQVTWAQFYQVLSRPDDALARWRTVVELDPLREEAHAAITTILLEQKRYSDVLDAATEGLQYAPESPRLHLARALAFEHLDRIYDARHDLDSFAPTTDDIDLLKHQAQIADTFGGDAAAAYRRLAEALGKSDSGRATLPTVIERGRRVSFRDGNDTAADWFTSQLPAARQPAKPPGASDPNAKQSNGVWIPGGFDALMFMARGQPASSPDRFFLEYCRAVLVNASNADPAEYNALKKSIVEYFAQLKTLLGMGVRQGNKTVITLSFVDKKNEKQTESLLAVLGWRIRREKQQITVESSEKKSQIGKQDLASALAIDQGEMQSAFRSGKPFLIGIPWERAPLIADERTILQLSQADKLTGGLPEAFVVNPDLARFYTGMSNLNQETAGALISSVGVNNLVTRYSALFSFYSSALAVGGGRVLVPGGAQADPVWNALAGVAPSNPPRFFRALFEKDDGKLLAFFSALSQLDSAHQRFFTLSAKRASSFYRLFTESEEVRIGMRGRKGSFVEFLRDIPLNDDATVDFPGSAEVWIVAKGESKTADKSEKMMRKVRKAVARDVEDEILLRIASTRYKRGSERFTELDNFLAVAHIDAHRSEPLDEESALLLAQNLNTFGSFYPYFAVFPDLTAADFKTVFSLGAKLISIDTLDADLAMGQFFSLVELTRLGLESGKLPEQRGAAIFRSLCSRFFAARDAAEFATASLDSVRDLLGTTSAPDADKLLAALVLGETAPVNFELNGAEHSLDPGRGRKVAFERVLNLQKAPSISVLLRMDVAVRSMAARKGPVEPLFAELLKATAALPVIEVPKSEKFVGRSKQAIERYNPAKLPIMITELREKAQRKKASSNDFEKLAREILIGIGPQVRLALTGIVYATYLRPEDTLAANDPLLLRKHRSFEMFPGATKQAFAESSLVMGNSNEGSYFVGSFAWFSHAAGIAAGQAVRHGSADGELYGVQIVATRTTAWSRYLDSDQRLLGLRIRMAREWLVYAANQPTLLRDVSDDTLGILSLSRRRELLNAIASEDWKTVWNSVTLSDLLSLSERYVSRYKQSPRTAVSLAT